MFPDKIYEQKHFEKKSGHLLKLSVKYRDTYIAIIFFKSVLNYQESFQIQILIKVMQKLLFLRNLEY